MSVAETRSEQNGSEYIDCDDLLVGLSRVGCGVAAAVLTDAGFDLAALDVVSADAR
ncbi:Clp protease N-terminal domain-containing protein [Streptomyces longisporoflavus]|uniref:Clp protease N-terminal domain-containing protein n=1 Tax=Streptomyces longisporoflavus TaxID=28044 RepID=UPI0027E58A09|nr:Clp protease N-terminal domain-containing protein [Streptomyces longisporoflavus]